MTVNMHTGEIVPVDTSSAMAVTSYLQQARDWLATAVESTGPETIAAAKAEIATAAEATKQLGLSKEIQTDALEMVRRAEYALGKSIRKGQAEGTIETLTDARSRAGNISQGVQHSDENAVLKRPVSDFISREDMTGNHAGIAHLVDGITDEHFEDAINEAKAEGNMSRANVVRKIKGGESAHKTRDQRAEVIRELAEQGWSSHQMVDKAGVGAERVREIARAYDIAIPADSRVGQARRQLSSGDITDAIVISLEGSAASVDQVDPTALDTEQLAYWATSLTESLRKLNRFAKQIKEIAQ